MRSFLIATVLMAAAATAVGCGGGGEGGGGAKAVNWYVFSEPGGAYDAAVATCNKQAKGAYKINYIRLPTDANQQRELLVRRLAAKDSSIDLMGMDVIWTAEFAQAKWIKPWTGANAAAATQDKLAGPVKSVRYKGKVWGIPFTSNTQLLWYRKDKVKTPPKTWGQMIDQALKLKTAIELQGRQYEGLTVLVNSLIASAGGSIVDQSGNVKVDATAKEAASIIKRIATSSAAPPGLSTNAEDEARLGFESGRSDFEINYPFIYPSAADVKEPKGFQKKIGWARWPAVKPGMKSRPPLGGINVGVGAYTKKTDLAFRAARCLAQPKNQIVATEKGGLPPTSQSLYSDPKVKKAYPFGKLLSQSIEDAAPRPINPAYSDISLAIQKSFHPENSIKPNDIESKLKDRLDKAAEGKIF
jgi:trehalose/maltose transport system substrate-binding protein